LLLAQEIRMKNIHIYPDTHGPFWKGVQLASGEIDCGLQEFLELIESACGCSGVFKDDFARVALLSERCTVEEGFWRSSAGAHPVRVARTLLGLHDTLRLAGWKDGGEHLYLDDLRRLTHGLPPGPAERIEAVLDALPEPFADIHLHTELSNIPPLWRKLMEALIQKGFSVEAHPAPERVSPTLLYRPFQSREAAREQL
jgi:hypothetical protein